MLFSGIIPGFAAVCPAYCARHLSADYKKQTDRPHENGAMVSAVYRADRQPPRGRFTLP